MTQSKNRQSSSGACPESLPQNAPVWVPLFRTFARDLALKIRCTLKNKNPLIAVKYGSPLTVQDHEPVHRKGRCTLKSGEPADRC